ncbi:MAG: heme-binding protein [Proteobacteria bacterium]|nr:heme-binding protein [Pseudomonadota bacterium]
MSRPPFRPYESAALLVALIGIWVGSPSALAIEEPSYEVVQQKGDLELRQYAPYYIVSAPAGTEFEKTGSKSFRTLFRYTSGANESGEEIAMTAPVN